MFLYNIFLIGMPSGGELLIIAIAILLMFGGKKIPELMKGIGQGIKEFKKSSKDEESDQEKNKKED